MSRRQNPDVAASSWAAGCPPDPVQFHEQLLSWSRDRQRSFPWRCTRDPFAVLLAEVMLQRTQAPQAARIFRDCIAKYSDAPAVLAADPREIEEQLAGLGLRHRARRMLQLCRVLVEQHASRVPDDRNALDALPGVGPYSANAVLCFGFGHDVPIVDRNVVRVLTRVFGFTPKARRPYTDRGLWLLAASLVPRGRSREYNLALLDFAAAVCTKQPRHDICPLRDRCCYYQQEQADSRISRSPGDGP